MFQAGILTLWNNLCGPQRICVWGPQDTNNHNTCDLFEECAIDKFLNAIDSLNTSDHEEIHEVPYSAKLLENGIYSTGQILVTEINSKMYPNEIRSRILFAPDQKMFLISIVFVTPPMEWKQKGSFNDQDLFCLSIVFKDEQFKILFPYFKYIDNVLRKSAAVLQKSKHISQAYEPVTKFLKQCSITLDHLLSSSNHNIKPQRILSILDDFNTSQLLEKSLVSHLQSRGQTFVVGNSTFRIKKVMGLLMLFEQPDLCTFGTDSSVHLGLGIQGSFREEVLLHKPVECIEYPTCLVDLNVDRVYINLDPSREDNTSVTRFHGLQPKVQIGTIVPQFFDELYQLETRLSLTEQHVANFNRYLLLKSTCLIKCRDAVKKNEANTAFMKQMKSSFNFEDHTDILIYAGVAANFKPDLKETLFKLY